MVRNILLLVSSYIFYGWWDWRFLILIFISSLADYFIGLSLQRMKDERKRKLLLVLTLVVNLTILGFFKYFNFFVDSFTTLLSYWGIKSDPLTLNIILPVGISFYTLQTLSYTIDIYRRNINATKDWVAFFAFVSFFPQLVAGPIERAANLLPQFYEAKKFDTTLAKDGLRQMLWGFVQKVMIADNCSLYVNKVFGDNSEYTGYHIILATIMFGFQIYGDFAGYSNIAIGTGKLFGYRLMKNFNYPFFATNFNDFWNRWHISLSTWFRDYLYIPLGGNRVSEWNRYRNLFIVFLISGLWHGASWNYVFWGLWLCICTVTFLFYKKRVKYKISNKWSYYFAQIIGAVTTFAAVTVGWYFFRLKSYDEIKRFMIDTYHGIVSAPLSILQKDFWQGHSQYFVGVIMFMIIEFLFRKKDFAFQLNGNESYYRYRWLLYFTIVMSLIIFGNFNKNEFIYFAF